MNERAQDLAKGMQQMQEACARLGRAMREAAEAFARAAYPIMRELAQQRGSASAAGRLYAHQFQGRAVRSSDARASLLGEQADYRAAMGIREAASAGEEYSRHNTS